MTLKRFGTRDWNYCREQLTNAHLIMADASQVMEDCIAKQRAGHNGHIHSGAWASEAFHVVNGITYAARAEFNPLIIPEYAAKAVESHRAGREFYSDDINVDGMPLGELISRVASEDEKKPLYLKRVIRLSGQESYVIDSERLGDEEVPQWAARGRTLAREYGKMLSEYGFPSVNINLPPTNAGNVVRSFWLDMLAKGNFSGIGCSYWFPDLVCGSMFGVPVKNEKI